MGGSDISNSDTVYGNCVTRDSWCQLRVVNITIKNIFFLSPSKTNIQETLNLLTFADYAWIHNKYEQFKGKRDIFCHLSPAFP